MERVPMMRHNNFKTLGICFLMNLFVINDFNVRPQLPWIQKTDINILW